MINDCKCGSEVNEELLDGSKVGFFLGMKTMLVFPTGSKVSCGTCAHFKRCKKKKRIICFSLTCAFFSPAQQRQSSRVALSGSRSEGGGCHGSRGACSLPVYDASHTHTHTMGRVCWKYSRLQDYK